MPVSLSVKDVPDSLAERLRGRAARHRRSLQRELLSILESAVDERGSISSLPLAAVDSISIEEAIARARGLFPTATASSVDYIRAMRDGR